jgi:hypothetical protein
VGVGGGVAAAVRRQVVAPQLHEWRIPPSSSLPSSWLCEEDELELQDKGEVEMAGTGGGDTLWFCLPAG